MSPKDERIAECRTLLQREGISSPRRLAARLGVTERTVFRYLRDMEGRCRKLDHYDEWMPLILVHLCRYPRSQFTGFELARRVLGDHSAVLASTLQRMEREKLVTCTVKPRNDGIFSRHQPVYWWQLHPDIALAVESAQEAV
ncbi:hypothetical protein FXF51_01595 [Nonomuraea sp. PA05]|uniref:hypothetical protein n=1 Tax=Nonomuraea sp. PA05 TaxID=2604466 RepID=UPI0011DAB555|nr:hypothetical protein [Nonomuraea sp. PA05]TYB71155.1 hypothetical protein FXF51_01595 [Nonomuraea sp. PA05]